MKLSISLKEGSNKSLWHDWFAWRPVIFETKGHFHFVFLQRIRRRLLYSGGSMGGVTTEYALSEEDQSTKW